MEIRAVRVFADRERFVLRAQITAASRILIGQNRNVPRNLDAVAELMADDRAQCRMNQRRVGAKTRFDVIAGALMIPFFADERPHERN